MLVLPCVINACHCGPWCGGGGGDGGGGGGGGGGLKCGGEACTL